MALESKRISQLDSIGTVANDDYYVIVDTSDTSEGVQGKTKKISHADLKTAATSDAVTKFRPVVVLNTAQTVILTSADSNKVFVTGHFTGTMVFQVGNTIALGSTFTIVTTSVGDVQIQTDGTSFLNYPGGIANIGLSGMISGGRRVDIICFESGVNGRFSVSGDL